MRIGLIDVDGGKSFPNLALMKISAYHKGRGDEIEWYQPFSGHYDKVYMSKVFSFTPDYDAFIDADEVERGGSGYCIELVNGKEVFHPEKNKALPHEIEHIYPDYSIYPRLTQDTAYGFLTRGCPRGCSFCIVERKEGKCSKKVADLGEFWRGQKNIVLCDPNILACKDWRELLTSLADTGATIDFNQGLDIRMMTAEKIELLNRIRIKEIHFAWDRYQDKSVILPKFKLFAEKSNRVHGHSAIVYTIVNFDTTIEQDLDRIYTLRDLGYWAYVMIYDKEHCAPVYKRLQRWCNNRFIFGRCKRFEDYDPRNRGGAGFGYLVALLGAIERRKRRGMTLALFICNSLTIKGGKIRGDF